MVAMANLGLSVYLFLYPDKFLEGFWTKMKMQDMHSIFHFPSLSKRHLLLHRMSIGDKCSNLCTDCFC